MIKMRNIGEVLEIVKDENNYLKKMELSHFTIFVNVHDPANRFCSQKMDNARIYLVGETLVFLSR